MRSKKSLVLVAAVLLLVPAAAFANGGWTIDARGGVGVPTGDFKNAYKSGLLIGLEASKMVSTNLAIGVDGNYVKNKGDAAVFAPGTDADFKFMHYGLHGKYMLSNDNSKMVPYMVAGAGLYNAKRSTTPTDGFDGSETKFGLRGGLGMNIMMSQKMGIGLQADYNDIMTSGSSTQFLGLSAGLHFMLTPSSSQSTSNQ